MTTIESISLEAESGSVAVGGLCQSGPLLLVLLRHFGCPLCREQLLVTAEVYRQLEALGIRVVGIGQHIGAEAEAYGRSLGLPFPVYGDTDNTLFRSLSLPRASWWQVTLGPMLRQPILALRRFRHVGKPGKDVQQLGGVALLGPSAELLWCYKQSDSGSLIKGQELLIAVTGALGDTHSGDRP